MLKGIDVRFATTLLIAAVLVFAIFYSGGIVKIIYLAASAVLSTALLAFVLTHMKKELWKELFQKRWFKPAFAFLVVGILIDGLTTAYGINRHGLNFESNTIMVFYIEWVGLTAATFIATAVAFIVPLFLSYFILFFPQKTEKGEQTARYALVLIAGLKVVIGISNFIVLTRL